MRGLLIRYALKAGMGAAALLLIATALCFESPTGDFRAVASDTATLQILDRTGAPLSMSYRNRWNSYDNLPLHAMPELLQQAFVTAEDKRFYQHYGVDWAARGSALLQRVLQRNALRGASSISEQVVRMLHPRARSFWSKWMEGVEAMVLEVQTSKPDILEFYLNQVPYASNRRGVVQASKFYFNRDISTLSTKEILALAVLVRAPGKFDLYAGDVSINASIVRLAQALVAQGALAPEDVAHIRRAPLELSGAHLPIEAFQFVDFVRGQPQQAAASRSSKILTTLDGNVQRFVSELLETRLQALAGKQITQAAALVVDHQTHEILAWVSVGAKCKATQFKASGCQIDMVTVPRQPGSALKPFLYAAALEKGWTAATIIDDSPYADSIGTGIHHFHNYSNLYYGKVSLRTALGNSLNIPALHTIHFVTPKAYLHLLRKLGFETLTRASDFYDEGLALGNGEVSLFELVQAYAVLANRGVFTPLTATLAHDAAPTKTRLYSQEVASLIGHILSDPWARSLEFGKNSVLNLPTQTAVKTGTSTDYRDAWAVGYNYRYAVGIWMGNTDYTATDGITGSLGPSLALRGIFNELTRHAQTAPLYLSPRLVTRDVCIAPEEAEKQVENCARYSEYFRPESPLPVKKPALTSPAPQIFRPAKGLHMALDPRIPRAKQAFEMRLSGVREGDDVQWVVDNVPQPPVTGASYLWPVTRGKHQVKASVWRGGKRIARTAPHAFEVK